MFIGPFEKCLEMGEMQFLLFIGPFEKCLEMGVTRFLLFVGTFEKCLEMGETQFLYMQLKNITNSLPNKVTKKVRRGVDKPARLIRLLFGFVLIQYLSDSKKISSNTETACCLG